MNPAQKRIAERENIEKQLAAIDHARHQLQNSPGPKQDLAKKDEALVAERNRLQDRYEELKGLLYLDQERINAKTTRLVHNLTLLDRLTGDHVAKVRLASDMTAPPGWYVPGEIVLNKAVLPDIDDLGSPEALAIWLGANAHELGHDTFSPGMDSKLMREIKQMTGITPHIRMVENLVEDQRIERLTVARYTPWEPYLMAAGIALAIDLPLMRRPDLTLGDLWPWLAGRTWLPTEYRAQSRAEYPGDAEELGDLIGQYQRLYDPGYTQVDEALGILAQIHDNLEDAGVFNSPPPLSDCGIAETVKGLPQSVYADDDDVPSSGSPQDLDDLADAEGGLPGDEAGEPEAGDGATGEGEASGSREPNGHDQDDDPSDQADQTDDTAGSGRQAGTGTSDDPADPIDQLKDAIRSAVGEAVMSDPDTMSEIEKLKNAMSEIDEHYKTKLPKDSRQSRRVPVPTPVQANAHRLTKEFDRLVAGAEPGWVRDSDHGRLNVDRYLAESLNPVPDYDTVFDQWKPGAEEAVSLDVSILLDTSSSMGWEVKHRGEPVGSLIRGASEAVWQIRQAIQAADGTCEVVTFSSGCLVAVPAGTRPHDEAMPLYMAHGNTYPQEALRESYRRLSGSQAAHRMVIVVTDGAWGNRTECKAVISEMRATGITVLGVVLHGNLNIPEEPGLPPHVEASRARSVRQSVQGLVDQMGVDPELTAIYDDPLDMVDQFRQVAERLIREAMLGEGVML